MAYQALCIFAASNLPVLPHHLLSPILLSTCYRTKSAESIQKAR